ncbi:hypothetical protein B0O80DRAFT_445878 [Mortierella sp. GBAus27b]|nr:hypothetical protein BGX31_006988 [Mortierella sp. GBA43]KAI8356813.1 hypothetical protein B0O80DRAFT_445878 [Mortierella sp. GBAus27b]
MAFNPKRASTNTSSSYAVNVTPRRQSRDSINGHISPSQANLSTTHTAAVTTPTTPIGDNGSSSSNRLSGLHLLNPLYTQHRNQSLKARVARTCPSLVHGTSRRKRSLWIMLCASGIVVMIYCLSVWDIRISSAVLDRASFSVSSQQRNNNVAAKDSTTVYKNPDGTDMDPKTIFMNRDFAVPQCQKAFARNEKNLPDEIRQERDQLRVENWASITKVNAWTMSLAWKRAFKEILPNWRDYIPGWVGQGVVLGAFPDGDGKNTIANTITQVKLIRSMSTIPIEVWFESPSDVSEEVHESLVSWGAIIRFLNQDLSTLHDAVVQSPDTEAPPPFLDSPISYAAIEEFKTRVGHKSGHLQKVLITAALINSGFEEIMYFSPSTLPMQSPRIIFQLEDYLRTGAVFWQHPTSFPAYDSPIWPILQADCDPSSYEQSWSGFVLKHKEAWKGLYLAWHWLTGPDYEAYESIFGKQGNDLLRLAWIGVKRPYVFVDRMPQAGLLDLSQYKGDGIGCDLESQLYPVPGSDVLVEPKKFAREQARQRRLFQQSHRDGTHEDLFFPNHNVMMVDTTVESSIARSGSNDQHIHRALDSKLTGRNPTRLVLTDVYAAGSEERVCLRIHEISKGPRRQ